MSLFDLFSVKNKKPASAGIPAQPVRSPQATAEYFRNLFATNFPGYTIRENMTCQELGTVPAAPAVPAAGQWKCSCGSLNSSLFCPNCGTKRPPVDDSWTCACGSKNKTPFCPSCGARRAAATAAVPAVPAPRTVPLRFVLYRDGKPCLAVILANSKKYHRGEYDPVNATIAYCQSLGIPCQRYFYDFSNKPEYVINRTREVLR